LGRIGQGVLAATAARLGFVFLAVGTPGLLVAIVKRLIGRARPYVFETTGPFDYTPFHWRAEFASLPSGHGTTAFATAFALGALYPRLRAPLWGFAMLIALSRVALAAHYPSDVLAGALAGILGALVVRNWFAMRRLAFAVGPDRSVQPLPGPSLRRLHRVLRPVWAR
jgi:undecaprenyl-diphosphatase